MMMGLAMFHIMFGDTFSPKAKKPSTTRVDTTSEAQEVVAVEPEPKEKEE
jgi:hypothetical protein